ncbi:MAG: hypothetical protein Kow001_24620 [Acidobacteriota bacterium]
MLRRLNALCLERRPATVTLGRMPRILPGRFVSVSFEEGFVELEVPLLPEDFEPGPCSPCTVVFRDGDRHQVLAGVTMVLDRPNRGLPRVRIALPMHAAPVELRSSWRIPLDSDSGLELRLHCGGRILRPQPVDISPGGVLVDLGPVAGLVPPEDELRLELRLGELRAELPVMPQRRSNRGLILYFAQVLRGLRHGRLVIPPQLKPILDRLECAWLSKGGPGPTPDRPAGYL